MRHVVPCLLLTPCLLLVLMPCLLLVPCLLLTQPCRTYQCATLRPPFGAPPYVKTPSCALGHETP